MLNKLTKKTVLLGSAAGTGLTLLLIVIFFNTSTSICPYKVTFNCSILSLTLSLLITLPIFLFSLVTYKMREEVFLFWRKFSFIYLFIYLFIVLISPWRPADFSPFAKGVDSIRMLELYVLISSALIAYKSYQLRGKK